MIFLIGHVGNGEIFGHLRKLQLFDGAILDI